LEDAIAAKDQANANLKQTNRNVVKENLVTIREQERKNLPATVGKVEGMMGKMKGGSDMEHLASLLGGKQEEKDIRKISYGASVLTKIGLVRKVEKLSNGQDYLHPWKTLMRKCEEVSEDLQETARQWVEACGGQLPKQYW